MVRTRASKEGNGLSNGPKTTTNSSGDLKTDYSRWRLRDERGVQTWHYLQTDEEVKEWPQSTADKWFLDLPTVQI